MPDKDQCVRDMFASIAPRYDLLNSLLSFNMHRYWRRFAVRACELRPGDSAIDVGVGTGDLAIELARAVAAARDRDVAVRNRFGPPPHTSLIRLNFPFRNAADPRDRFGIRSVFASWQCGAEKTVTLPRLTDPYRRSVLVS